MGRDASLDDFLGSSDESDQQPTDGLTEDEQSTDESADEEAETPDAVSPAVSTATWAGDGAVCDACGASVERRWRDEGRLVCGDCKSW